MKKLIILTMLMISSLALSNTSFASGSCTPPYLAYSSAQCTFEGNSNYLDFYYINSTSGNIYLSLWGSVGAGGVYVYNYITSPGGFDWISVYSGEPDVYYSTTRSGASGNLVLYTESVGDNNFGGVSASW